AAAGRAASAARAAGAGPVARAGAATAAAAAGPATGRARAVARTAAAAAGARADTVAERAAASPTFALAGVALSQIRGEAWCGACGTSFVSHALFRRDR